MRSLLIALVIGVIAWQAWGAYQTRTVDEEAPRRQRIVRDLAAARPGGRLGQAQSVSVRRAHALLRR